MTCVFVFCLLHTVNGMKSSKSYINTDIWLDDFLKESNDMDYEHIYSYVNKHVVYLFR